MAIYGYNSAGNRDLSKPLSNRQIKQEILQLTQLTPEQYKKQYDIIKNRLRNYEALTGAKTPQAVNEFILRVARRDAVGAGLTAEQKGILATTSARTSTFARAVEEGRASRRQNELAIQTIENIFSGFRKKTSLVEYRPFEEIYQEFMNQKVGERDTGDVDAKGKPIIEPILRSEIITPAELQNWYASKAKELHEMQKALRDSATIYYTTNKMKVGS